MAKRLVSIDIGSRNIHVIEGSGTGKLLKIKKAFTISTPPNCLIDGRVEDKISLKDALKQGLGNYKIRSRNAVLSVQSSSVIIRDLVLPVTQKQEQLAGAVAYEMDQYVSVDGRNNITEFKVVDEILEDGIKKYKIRVASMPKEMTDTYYSIVKDIRYKPFALDVHSNSVSKIFSGEIMINSSNYYPDKCIIVIDMGYKTTMVNIISNGVLEFTRLVAYGSRDIDMIISNFYNITPAEAEAKKTDDIDLSKINENSADDDNIYNSLKVSLINLSRELMKVIQYYTSRTSSSVIDAIYLYGGGSKIKGYDNYLMKTLNINRVVRIESIKSPDITFSTEDLDMPLYINAIGAMIRL